jgi:hypothetical protein
VLDRVDQFPEFDPREHYSLTVNTAELTEVERNAAHGPAEPANPSADHIELDL